EPFAVISNSRCQTTHLVPAAHFLRPGFATLLRSPESRGGRSAERRSGARRNTRGARHNAACQALASLALRTVFARLFSQPWRKPHVSHQKVTGNFPTARDAVRRVRRSPPLIALRTGHRRSLPARRCGAVRTRFFAWAAMRGATQRGGSLKSDAARR